MSTDLNRMSDDDADKLIRDGLIQEELERQLVRREARRLLDAQPFTPPPVLTLKDLVDKPLPPIRWAVKDLMAVGHNVLLSAEYKTGKSTLLLNLIRALVDGRPFLDRFPTSLDGNVCYMNYELTEQDCQLWVRESKIRRTSRCTVMNLRGMGNPLSTEEGQNWLISYLSEFDVEFLVIDTFRAAYDGVSHNDNAEVGRFTRLLDHIKEMAGVQGLVLANHFGRKEHESGREHGAGASELDNWADMRWLLTRKDDERFLKAEGRGVGLDESLLTWDRDTRRLMILKSDLGVNRERAGLKPIQDEIMDYLRGTPRANTNKIVEALGSRRTVVIQALKDMVDAGMLTRHEGPRNSAEFTVNDDEFVEFD